MIKFNDVSHKKIAMLLWNRLTFNNVFVNHAYNIHQIKRHVTGADVNVPLKAVITRINPRESEGLYQTTDLKVIIGTAELGTYFPTEADRVQYTQDGATREAKIIAITSYRGTNPVLHTLIARPQ